MPSGASETGSEDTPQTSVPPDFGVPAAEGGEHGVTRGDAGERALIDTAALRLSQRRSLDRQGLAGRGAKLCLPRWPQRAAGRNSAIARFAHDELALGRFFEHRLLIVIRLAGLGG